MNKNIYNYKYQQWNSYVWELMLEISEVHNTTQLKHKSYKKSANR